MNNRQENQYIGCNIKKFRIRCGMTETILAIKLSKIHKQVSKNSIRAAEQGSYRLSPQRLYHIAKILNVKMEELVE